MLPKTEAERTFFSWRQSLPDIDFGRGHNGRPDDYAGLHWLSYPALAEKVVTMVRSFVVVGLWVNATNALVVSQVVLSLALPFPMMALLWFSYRQDIMGVRKNRPGTNILATVAAAIVLSLNAFLLLQTFGVALPG